MSRRETVHFVGSVRADQKGLCTLVAESQEVTGLAWSWHGAQLAAVTGRNGAHIWSLAPSSITASTQGLPSMRHLSSWSANDLYSSGTGIVRVRVGAVLSWLN